MSLVGEIDPQRVRGPALRGGGNDRDGAGVVARRDDLAGEAGEEAVRAVDREGVLAVGRRRVPGVAARGVGQDGHRRGGERLVGVGVDKETDTHLAAVRQRRGYLAVRPVDRGVSLRLVVAGPVRAAAGFLNRHLLVALGWRRGRAAGLLRERPGLAETRDVARD